MKDSPLNQTIKAQILNLCKVKSNSKVLEQLSLLQATTVITRFIMDKILSINVDKRMSTLIKILDLTQSNQRNKPIIILIQDPPILIREIKIKTFIYGYNIITPQEPDHYNNIILYEKELVEPVGHCLSSKHTLGLEFIFNNKCLIIFSLYLRPRISYKDTRDTLQIIKEAATRVGKSRLIIGGDTNATDMFWAPISEVNVTDSLNEGNLGSASNAQRKNTRGRQIRKFLEEMKLTCLNDISKGPTFVSDAYVNRSLTLENENPRRHPSSYIDILAVGQKALRQWKSFEILNIIGSQHKLLIIQSNRGSSSRRNIKGKEIYKIEEVREEQVTALILETEKEVRENYWEMTDELLRMRIDRLTDVILKHTLDIQESVKRVIVVEGKRRTSGSNVGAQQIRKNKMLSRLKRLETSVQRSSGSRQDRINNEIQRIRNSLIYELEKPIINMANVNKENEMWEIVHRIELINNNYENVIHSSKQNSTNSINSQEEIERIADIKFNKEHSIELAEDLSADIVLNIARAETENAIYNMRNKKFTGPEGLRFTTFNKLLQFESYRKIIYTWVSMCFKASYIPHSLRLTSGKLIPKKAQGQFRIVHLCSPMLVILEQIALIRLEYRLEQNFLYNTRQFGFKALRSRHDLVARILERCIKNQLEQNFQGRTYIISLDIKGAFDNVDQEILKKKIVEDLVPDPIRFWLANFVQNRRIKIKFKNIVSNERIISKGVPQGSSLGPILWNFAINQIDRDFVSDYETFEVLAYADDIYIIFNGINRQSLQMRMNKLIDRISELNLEVEPSKCSYMAIDFTTDYDLIESRVKIYDEYIKKVDRMLILGVPITHKLELDIEDSRFKERLLQKIQLLNLVKRYDMITTNKEWKMLLSSYIESVVITNNIPIYALDNKAIEWANKLIDSALRIIFDWPKNCSTKVMRLLTDMDNTHNVITNAIEARSYRSEVKDSYNILKMTAGIGGIRALQRFRMRGHIPTTVRPLTLADQAGYIFKDPDTNWIIRGMSELQSLYEKGPIWLAVTSRRTASLFLMINNIILEEYKGEHLSYPIGHFNLMALIYTIIRNPNLTTRTIVFQENNSVFTAIKNGSNHNWRINTLRSMLLQEGWLITTIDLETYHSLIAVLIREGRIYKRSRDISEYNNFELRTRDVTRIRSDWPPVEDYIAINAINSRSSSEKETERRDNSSRLTRKLARDYNCLRTLPPSWIDGRTMLMLSGLISKEDNSLAKGSVEVDSIPFGCDETCRHSIDNTIKDRWNCETTLHRAFMCPRFKMERITIRRTINQAMMEAGEVDYSQLNPWNIEGAVEITLNNRRLGQTLLRILKRVAFN